MSPLPVSSQPNADENQKVDPASPPRQEFAFGMASPVARQEQLLLSEYLSDVVFKVGSTGQLIHAHKLILTVASEVFYAQFNGEFDESKKDNRENPIVIEDIEPEIFKHVLRYIYCQKIDLTPENVMDIYCVSEKYLLTGLKTVCDNFLKKNLNVKNVLKVFDSNRRYGFENVDKLCLAIIRDDPITCFESQDFPKLRQSAVEMIAACPTMNCRKKQLCSAIRKWCETNDSKADILYGLESMQCRKLSAFGNFRYDTDINTDLKINVKGTIYLYGLGIFIGQKLFYPSMVTVTVNIEPQNRTVSQLITIKNDLFVEKIMFAKLTVTDECRITVTFSKPTISHSLFCLEEFKAVDTLGQLEFTVTDMKASENVTPRAASSLPLNQSVFSSNQNYSFGTVVPKKQKTNCVAYILYGLEPSVNKAPSFQLPSNWPCIATPT